MTQSSLFVIWMLVMQGFLFVQTYQIVSLRSMHLAVYKLCLTNKIYLLLYLFETFGTCKTLRCQNDFRIIQYLHVGSRIEVGSLDSYFMDCMNLFPKIILLNLFSMKLKIILFNNLPNQLSLLFEVITLLFDE